MERLDEILHDPSELSPFLEKNWARLLSDWSYAAGTQDHYSLGEHAKALVRVIDACTASPSLIGYAQKISQEIITENLKVVYRSLYLTRAHQTVATLELLQRVVKFAPESLYNSFDFSLNIIPKLLVSKDFRAPFIRFYIAFIQSAGALARKDLIGQKKIMKGWLKKLEEDKNAALISESLDCLKDCVLRNKLLNKSQKLGFFNDNLLHDLSKLLNREAEVASKASEFFLGLFSDRDHGLIFKEVGWTSQTPNNKLLLSCLQILKPWENTVQMELCIKLLSKFSELMFPYFDHMGKVYPFIPKVTMFWFNYATLISRAVQTPVPTLEYDNTPDSAVVIANILPQPLTKSHLYAAVTYKDNALIAFQATQIVLHSLRKLDAILQIYKQQMWDATPIVADIFERLPNINVFSTPSSSKLLQTELLMCASLYYKVLGTASVTRLPPSIVNSILDQHVVDLDRVQAQSILEIQTRVLGSTKWFNKGNDKYCFFTRLLKFILLNPELSYSAVDLLKVLVKPLLTMQDETYAHPVDALVYTLEANWPERTSQQEKLLRLIDEAVSRSSRSPFVYIDQHPALLSPFATALVEQLAFVEEPSTDIKEWLASYLRALKVIGENSDQIMGSLKLGKLPLNDYFEFVLSEDEKKIRKRTDLMLKITTPLELMATIQRAIDTPNLAHHLFTNIPPRFLHSLSLPVCLNQILNCGSEKTIDAYLFKLRDAKFTTPEIAAAIAKSPHWSHALELLDPDFLFDKVRANEKTHKVISELTRRKLPLPIDLVKDHLNEHEHLRILNIDPETAFDLMSLAKNSGAVAALIEASGCFFETIDTSPEVLLAACKYAPSYVSEEIKSKCLEVASSLLGQDPATSISIFVSLKGSLRQYEVPLTEFLDNVQQALVPEYAVLAAQITSPAWLQRAVHQSTKCLSEFDDVSTYEKFFEKFTHVFEVIKVWELVPSDNLNAMISSLLSRTELGSSDIFIKFLNAVVYNANGIHHSKHLQAILGKEPPFFENKLQVNMVIWRLFFYDTTRNTSKDTQIGVLRHYSGMSTAADSLLLEVLRTMETTTSLSWVDNVMVWNMQAKFNLEEYDRPALIDVAERGDRLQVTLCDDLVSGTATHFDPYAQLNAPAHSESPSSLQQLLEEYDIMHPSYGYSDEFLLACIPSCDQLLRDENKIDVKLLCDMGFLPLICSCLCSHNANVSSMAHLLLEAVAGSIVDQKYKESTAVTLVVNKALLYLHQNNKAPPHIAIILGQIARISLSPNHFLHEKVSDWLMSGPSIQIYDLPLYSAIINSNSTHKQHECIWLIKSFTQAAVDGETVALFIKLGVFEWAFAQLAILSSSIKPLKNAIDQFVSKAELVGGSDALIRRTAALSYKPSGQLYNTSADVLEWMGYA